MKVHNKRMACLLVITILLSLTPVTSSFALSSMATLQQKAELLNALSVLNGFNGEYRLGDKLSRSEAAAFAVRMLGKEAYVLGNANLYKKTAYPDVAENMWYAPYVGFCTQEGILSGDTSGMFKPNDFITEKSFIKILLGVLEYKINVDYVWEGVYKKAFEVGLVTELSYIVKTDDNSDFTRADAVRILYNALTVKTKATGKELFYKLIDSGMITDAKAIELGLIEKNGTEQENQGTEAEEVNQPVEDAITTEIEEINVFDATNISVHFNEDVKSIGKVKIYESSNSSRFLGLHVDTADRNYIMIITDVQTPGVEYKIEITDVEDLYGYKQEKLEASFKSYSPEVVESNFFRIKKLEPVNEKSILVYFTHPINVNAENPLYYKITQGSHVLADGEKDQIISRIYNTKENCVMLSLKTNTFSEGEEYSIELDGNLTSAYGAHLNQSDGDRMGFIAKEGKEERFKLDQIIPYDDSTLMLVFNKEINPFLAQQIYNFYITDEDDNPVTIDKTMLEGPYSGSGDVLFINIKDKFKKNALYYLTINNLNDITRQEYITETTYSFEADYGSKDRQRIKDIIPVNNQRIDVYFANGLDPISATEARNYSLKYGSSTRIYPSAVYFDQEEDPTKVVLYFSNSDRLAANREYELQIVKGFKDHMGNMTTSILEEEFKASSKTKRNISVEEVVPVSSDTIKVVFDDAIAFDKTNLSLSNYSLEYNYLGLSIKEIPLSILYFNSKTLIMKFNEMHYDLPYTFKFNTIVDYFGSSYKVTGDGTNYVEFVLQDED